jgi:hypothetical protein
MLAKRPAGRVFQRLAAHAARHDLGADDQGVARELNSATATATASVIDLWTEAANVIKISPF